MSTDKLDLELLRTGLGVLELRCDGLKLRLDLGKSCLQNFLLARPRL